MKAIDDWLSKLSYNYILDVAEKFKKRRKTLV